MQSVFWPPWNSDLGNQKFMFYRRVGSRICLTRLRESIQKVKIGNRRVLFRTVIIENQSLIWRAPEFWLRRSRELCSISLPSIDFVSYSMPSFVLGYYLFTSPNMQTKIPKNEGMQPNSESQGPINSITTPGETFWALVNLPNDQRRRGFMLRILVSVSHLLFFKFLWWR